MWKRRGGDRCARHLGAAQEAVAVLEHVLGKRLQRRLLVAANDGRVVPACVRLRVSYKLGFGAQGLGFRV